MKGRVFTLGLTVCLSASTSALVNEARAQGDLPEPPAGVVQQVVDNVPPYRALRMATALLLKYDGNYSPTGAGSLFVFDERQPEMNLEKLAVGVRWDVSDSPAFDQHRGFAIRARLRVGIVRNPRGNSLYLMHRQFVLGQWSRAPLQGQMKFIYNKQVLISYSLRTRRLIVQMVDAQDEHGLYNLLVTRTIRQSIGIDSGLQAGVSSGDLKVGVKYQGETSTVSVTGLPFVARPHLEVRKMAGGYLNLGLGMIWESQVNISGRIVAGHRTRRDEKANLDLGWDKKKRVGLEIDGSVNHSQTDATLSMTMGGKGIRAGILYDESLAHRAFETVTLVDQQYAIQVHELPGVTTASVQEEASEQKGRDWDCGFLCLWRVEDKWLPAPVNPGGLSTGQSGGTGIGGLIGRLRGEVSDQVESRRRGGHQSQGKGLPNPTTGSSRIVIHPVQGLETADQRWDKIRRRYRTPGSLGGLDADQPQVGSGREAVRGLTLGK